MMNNQFANATTMWESWFFSDNTFSHNHPMFGSSEVWLLQSVAGIQPHPAAKGMDRVLIKPSPPSKLDHAAASFDTPRGTVSVSWARKAGGGFTLTTTIPPNVQATVHIPSRAGTHVLEGDQGGELEQEQARKVQGRRVSAPHGSQPALIIELGSGQYHFHSTL